MAVAHSPSQDREDLLDAVVIWLEALGSTTFTLSELARALGISRVTLHRRFGPREQLVETLLAERKVPQALVAGLDPQERILQAARTVFLRDGIAQSSIETIAAVARVGPATMYRRFNDKTNLITALFKRFSPTQVASQFVADEDATLSETLTSLLGAVMAHAHKERGLLRLALVAQQEVSGLANLHRESSRELTTTLRIIIERALADGQIHSDVAAPELAVMLSSQAMGFAWINGTFTGEEVSAEDLPAIAGRIVSTFLFGVGPTQ